MIVRDDILAVAGFCAHMLSAVAFGLWQRSFFAGLWFGLLVLVAVAVAAAFK